MTPQRAIQLLDTVTAGIQLIATPDGRSLGLTRIDHANLIEAIKALRAVVEKD